MNKKKKKNNRGLHKNFGLHPTLAHQKPPRVTKGQIWRIAYNVKMAQIAVLISISAEKKNTKVMKTY